MFDGISTPEALIGSPVGVRWGTLGAQNALSAPFSALGCFLCFFPGEILPQNKTIKRLDYENILINGKIPCEEMFNFKGKKEAQIEGIVQQLRDKVLTVNTKKYNKCELLSTTYWTNNKTK